MGYRVLLTVTSNNLASTCIIAPWLLVLLGCGDLVSQTLLPEDYYKTRQILQIAALLQKAAVHGTKTRNEVFVGLELVFDRVWKANLSHRIIK